MKGAGKRSTVVIVFLSLITSTARAGPVVYTDLYAFLNAAGNVHTIDFETLPDGSPSYSGAQITPEFNYTKEGVTFSAPTPDLRVLGVPGNHYLFTNDSSGTTTRLIATLTNPARAFGVEFAGATELSFLDSSGELITRAYNGGNGIDFGFTGIVSNIPIASVVGFRGAYFEGWQSVRFTPIPEPSTGIALLAGIALCAALRRGRMNSAGAHSRSILLILLVGFITSAARAGVVVYTDLPSFLQAAGDVHTIDFKTLPDGSPSYAGAMITPEFNYTSQGISFASPYGQSLIAIAPPALFLLHTADPAGSSGQAWMVADLIKPVSAFGIEVPGGTMLSAFDAAGALIESTYHVQSGYAFLGLTSDVPIASVISDRSASFEDWSSVRFTPIPEPSSVISLLMGITVFVGLKGRRRLSVSMRLRSAPSSRAIVIAFAFAGSGVCITAQGQTCPHASVSKTWTSTGDFNNGFPINGEGRVAQVAPCATWGQDFIPRIHSPASEIPNPSPPFAPRKMGYPPSESIQPRSRGFATPQAANRPVL
ncbi:MAG: PEP-CTERM sorting domain-containing protein [Planctomycetes bacterium]|nr:PEP-CTERM sorting domain-containing protein [Planctomycetota bacterium]MBI3833939.1 PEP-CTERM sorting domain-containing protein [Planctomycetota bacterium]